MPLGVRLEKSSCVCALLAIVACTCSVAGNAHMAGSPIMFAFSFAPFASLGSIVKECIALLSVLVTNNGNN
jgi:hypothetical protein